MFTKDTLRQEGGDGSTNYQAARDITYYHGLDYASARQIALDLFEAKRRELVREAAEVAQARAEELVTDFLDTLYRRSPECLDCLREPDVQFSLGAAEVAYARSGDKGLEKLLVQLLVQRAEEQGGSLQRVLLNEAIVATGKLLPCHFAIISLLYLLENFPIITISSADELIVFLSKVYLPFATKVSTEETHLYYLENVGCATNSEKNSNNFLVDIYNRYGGLFPLGFSPHELQIYIDYHHPWLLFGQDGHLYEEILNKFVCPCIHDTSLLQFNVTDLKELNSKVPNTGYFTIRNIEPIYHNFHLNYDQIEHAICTANADLTILFDFYKTHRVCYTRLTCVGTTLAIVNCKTVLGELYDTLFL